MRDRARRNLDRAARVLCETDRIAILGTTGSGKTTIAKVLSRFLNLPRIELDDLHWGDRWTTRPDFVENVRAFVARDRWVTEWQYSAVRPIIAARAEVFVWLDLPVTLRLWRCFQRTLRRRFTREPMWRAGLIEPPLATILHDSDHILRWAWRTRDKYRGFETEFSREYPGRILIRIRSTRALRRLLFAVARQRSAN